MSLVAVINSAGYAVPVYDISRDTQLFRFNGEHFRVKKGDVSLLHPYELGRDVWQRWIAESGVKFSDELNGHYFHTFPLAKIEDVKAKAISGL